MGLSGSGPEREYACEGSLGFVDQGVGVVAEAFGGLVAGEGDLCREAGGGLVGSAADEKVAELVDSTLKEQVMRAYPREVPRGAPMFAQLGIASGPDPDAFAAAASRVAVFEIPPRAASAVKPRRRSGAPQNWAGCRASAAN